MKNETGKLVTLCGCVEDMKAKCADMADLLATLADGISTDEFALTLENLCDAELVIINLHRAMTAPEVVKAFCNLTKAAVLDREDLENHGIIPAVKSTKA